MESDCDGTHSTDDQSSVSKCAVPKRKSNRYRNYLALLAAFAIHVTVSSLFYTYYEGWSPSVAMFFVIDTTSSVGKCFRTGLQ
jgi:hypothetical protein